MPAFAGIQIVEARGPMLLELARTLFRQYAAEFAGSIAESLCFQGFEAELVGLPGRYGPPGGCLLLAMDGDVPACCLAVRGLDESTCEMKRLYVMPEYRGKRLGRRLVEEAITRARRLGYNRMRLDTIPDMAHAVRLYRSLGFVAIDRYCNSPIEGTIYLEKTLLAAADPPNRVE